MCGARRQATACSGNDGTARVEGDGADHKQFCPIIPLIKRHGRGRGRGRRGRRLSLNDVDQGGDGEGEEEQAVAIQEGSVLEDRPHDTSPLGGCCRCENRMEKCICKYWWCDRSAVSSMSLRKHACLIPQPSPLTNARRRCCGRCRPHRHGILLVLGHCWQILSCLAVVVKEMRREGVRGFRTRQGRKECMRRMMMMHGGRAGEGKKRERHLPHTLVPAPGHHDRRDGGGALVLVPVWCVGGWRGGWA